MIARVNDDDTSDIARAVQDAAKNANQDAGARLSSAFDSSKIISEDGTVFGMPVSRGTENTIRMLLDQGMPHLANKVDDQAAYLAERFAKNVLGKTSTKELTEFGGKWGKYAGYGIMLAQPLAEMAATAYQTSSRINELRKAVYPVLKANGLNPALEGIFNDGNNEVISNARAKISSGAMNEIVKTMARSVAIIPGLAVYHKKQREKSEAYEKEARYRLLAEGSADEYAKFVEEEMKQSSSMATGQQGRLKEALNKAQEQYNADFKTFVGENERKVKVEVEKELKADLIDLKDYGLDERSMFESAGSGDWIDPNKNKRKMDGGKPVLRKEGVKKLVDMKLMERFSDAHMPWDETWLPKGRRGSYKDKPQTLRQGIIDTHNKVLETMQEHMAGAKKPKEGGNKEFDGILQQAWLGLGTLGGELAQNFIGSSADKRLKEQIALDQIINMRKQLDENSERQTIEGKGKTEQEYSFAQYVHKIFQQNQHDSGQAEISERFFSHLKAESWSDKDIQKMADADLSAYEVAIKHISKNIKDGRMDALALINLVGQRKVVAKDGKSFGNLAARGDEDELKAGLIREIDKQAALLKPNHHMEDEQVSQHLADYTFTTDELKAAFGANGLKGEERAFVFALVDANTPDDKVLKEITGVSDEEMKKLRLDVQEHFNTHLDAAIREIAELPKEQIIALEDAHRLSEDERKTIKGVVAEAESSHSSAASVLDSENKKAVEKAVTNVLMAKEEVGSGLWQNRIKPRAGKIEEEVKIDAAERHAHKHDDLEQEEFAADKQRDRHHSRSHNGHENKRSHGRDAEDEESRFSSRHADKKHKKFSDDFDDLGDVMPHAAKVRNSQAHQMPWSLAT